MKEYPEYTEETIPLLVAKAYGLEDEYNARWNKKSEGPNLILILPYGNGFFFSSGATATLRDFRRHMLVHPDATDYEVWQRKPKIRRIRKKRTAK